VYNWKFSCYRPSGKSSVSPIAQLRGAIIIDGLDECEADKYHDTSTTDRRGRPERTNAEGQLEILQVLQAASSGPSFPFRILIASRPERVFREFFRSSVQVGACRQLG
jgi:hypothetical protein